MCGIFGFTGQTEATDLLIHGLKRLEYRGYDSSGVAIANGQGITVRKKSGRIAELQQVLSQHPAHGSCGISHTRWATHGTANDANSHPHMSGCGSIAVVHNGVIENYATIKEQLQADGIEFRSNTDTEVLPHLIARYYQGNLVEAVQAALGHVRGTYGIAVVCRQHPGVIVGARLGSPLAIGIGDKGLFLSSDANALAGFATRVVHLHDGQLCQLTPAEWTVLDSQLDEVPASYHDIDLDDCFGSCELTDYPHYMLKEIYEQPTSLENAMRGRLDERNATAHFGGLNLDSKQLRSIERIIITGCGTSYHAGLVGEYLFEEFARIPVEVEYASELRYRNPPIDRNTIMLAMTQSGETADTLAALRESQRMGHTTLAICNSVGSSIAREADGGVYLHAGPEIGVASTKAFTSQVTVLAMLALYFGRMRHLTFQQGRQFIEQLQRLPGIVQETLQCHSRVREVAEKYWGSRNMLYLGRQYLFPAALEGALKLKEISYIHAEGYPAAEMKHGPIALVDEETPSLFLVPRGNVFDKVMSNMEEIKARGGPVIALCSENDREVGQVADDVIPVPDVPDFLQPVVTAVPLQLLAYEIDRKSVV